MTVPRMTMFALPLIVMLLMLMTLRHASLTERKSLVRVHVDVADRVAVYKCWSLPLYAVVGTPAGTAGGGITTA
jgi:hypothetical protein